MGGIGQGTYVQDMCGVTGAYLVNCAETATTSNQNYTLLTVMSQSTSSLPVQNITVDSNVKEEYYLSPYLEIIEQPFPRHRFRYESEGLSHGGMVGATNTETRRTYPTVRLNNFIGDPCQIRIKASLCTDSGNPQLHVHKLQHKTCISPVEELKMQLNNDMICIFQQVSIIFTAKKQVPDILYQRKLRQINPLEEANEKALKLEAKNEAKNLNMNAVRIRFDAILPNGHLIATILSNPVCHQSIQLKITRFTPYSGSCRGNDEVFMFCEKVNKEKIKIRFFECDEARNRNWEAYGTFTAKDVHHQVAIAFKTPRYHNVDIYEPVKVWIELCYTEDNECSEPVEFTYRPETTDEERLSRKRPKRYDDTQNRTQPNQDAYYLPNSSFPENIASATGPIYPILYSGGQDKFGGFTYTTSTVESSNESSNSSFRSTALNPISSPPSSVPTNTTDISNESNNSSNQRATSFGLNRHHQSSSDTNDSSSLHNIFNSSVLPSSLVTLSLGDSLDLNAFPDTMFKPDGSRNHDSANRRVSLDIDGLGMAVAEMDLNHTTDIKPADFNLPLPSVRQRRSMSLVEEKGGQSMAESFTLQILLNRLGQAIRQYATSADPNALIIPLTNLLAKQDENGENALHLAIIHQSSNEAFLQHLLRIVPAELLNYKNKFFQTPLHLAVILDKPLIVQLLLMKGAHPDIQDKDGNTAVHLAVLKKRYICLDILLNKQTYGGRIVSLDFTDILNYNGYAAFHFAVISEDEHCITKLADAGANINIGVGTNGKSALHLAVEQKSFIIKCLLRQINIDVNYQDFSGDTPLHLACIQGSEEIVLQLMEADANPLIENHILPEGDEESEIPRGVTPYDIAAETNNEMIKSLLAGVIPTDFRRKISASSKMTFQEIYTHDCTKEFDCKPPLSPSNSQTEQKSQEASSLIDSGYTSGPKFNDLPEELVEKLCKLLDPPNQGWQDLVRELIDPDKVESFKILYKTSYTKGILEQLKKQGELTVEALKNLFEALNIPCAQALFEN